MLRLTFATATVAILLVPTPAAANSCALAQPVVEVSSLPVGCPSVLHTSQSYSRPFDAPTAEATRILAGGATETVAVTGAIQRSTTTLPIDEYYYETATSCALLSRARDEVFDTLTLELTGVMAGDQVDFLDGSIRRASLTIVAAGPCPEPEAQTLACAAPIQSCDQDGDGTPDHLESEDGGCSAGGQPSLAIALALGLLGLRRRRP